MSKFRLHKNQQDLLTIADVRKLFSCSRSTVYNWIKTGDLPQPKKVGHLTYFTREQIENVFE